MSSVGLDQIVKGSPPPNISFPNFANDARNSTSSQPPSSESPDPTLQIPASPPQIYLNLLILEASLRAQYLTLRARRRQNTLVLILLGLWLAYFFWCQFLRPREDGTGVGGSVYWLLDMLEKVSLIAGVVMAALFRLTGQWERGVRWPTRWLRTTNRGLRGMNCKVVVVMGPWWREVLGMIGWIIPIGKSFWGEHPGSNYQLVEYPTPRSSSGGSERRVKSGEKKMEVAEEDIAAGGDHVKVLLLPKHFTPEFRENWEMFRAEYWIAENTRRAELRAKIQVAKRAWAKQVSPWLWWVPGRIWLLTRTSGHHHHNRHHHHQQHQSSKTEKIGTVRHRRSGSALPGREKEKEKDKDRDHDGDHSRSSSRSSRRSSVIDFDHENTRERRLSSASTASSIGLSGTERRRRKKVGAHESNEGKRSSIVGRVKIQDGIDGRPSTPPSRGGEFESTKDTPPKRIKRETSAMIQSSVD